MKRSMFLAMVVMTLVGCATTNRPDVQPSSGDPIADNARRGAGIATAWGLARLSDANDTAATVSAKGLLSATARATAYLQSDGATATAEVINTFLFNVLIKDLPGPVGLAIDTGGAVLDGILGPVTSRVGTMLTKEELRILVAFAQGMNDGATAFLAGYPATQPAVTRNIRAPGGWLRSPMKNRELVPPAKASAIKRHYVNEDVGYCLDPEWTRANALYLAWNLLGIGTLVLK